MHCCNNVIVLCRFLTIVQCKKNGITKPVNSVAICHWNLSALNALFVLLWLVPVHGKLGLDVLHGIYLVSHMQCCDYDDGITSYG